MKFLYFQTWNVCLPPSTASLRTRLPKTKKENLTHCKKSTLLVGMRVNSNLIACQVRVAANRDKLKRQQQDYNDLKTNLHYGVFCVKNGKGKCYNVN